MEELANGLVDREIEGMRRYHAQEQGRHPAPEAHKTFILVELEHGGGEGRLGGFDGLHVGLVSSILLLSYRTETSSRAPWRLPPSLSERRAYQRAYVRRGACLRASLPSRSQSPLPRAAF